MGRPQGRGHGESEADRKRKDRGEIVIEKIGLIEVGTEGAMTTIIAIEEGEMIGIGDGETTGIEEEEQVNIEKRTGDRVPGTGHHQGEGKTTIGGETRRDAGRGKGRWNRTTEMRSGGE